MKYDDACGDFSLEAYADALKTRYGLFRAPSRDFVSYDIRPSQMSPVVYADEKGKPVLEEMKWGLIPSWWKDDPKIGYKLFNARDDKVFSSGMWRGIYRKRALVPATGYFEWTKEEPKRKYYYHPKQMDIFSFAGIYDVWKGAEGKEIKTFTIITTEPNKEAAKVHNRMPVLLHKDDEAAWIDPSRVKREEIERYIHPYEDGGLKVDEVVRETKGLAFNDKALITPLA